MPDPPAAWATWTARPRWSHRDPVEGGNPFPVDDVGHERWRRATGVARRELVQLDARLDAEQPERTSAASYATGVVELAVHRFDIWARRGLAVVGRDTRHGYARWLTRYADNWLGYVADTCPRLEVAPELARRLAERVTHWAGEATSRRETA